MALNFMNAPLPFWCKGIKKHPGRFFRGRRGSWAKCNKKENAAPFFLPSFCSSKKGRDQNGELFWCAAERCDVLLAPFSPKRKSARKNGRRFLKKEKKTPGGRAPVDAGAILAHKRQNPHGAAADEKKKKRRGGDLNSRVGFPTTG
jgi:hypothetical protein